MRNVLVALALIAGLAAGRTAPLDPVWSFLTSAWSDAGLGIDPDGGPRLEPESDEGLGMDPSGKPGS